MSKIKILRNIKLNALLVYEDRYIKIKIRTYDDQFYTNCHSLNGLKCDFCTIISVTTILVYNSNFTSKHI